MLHDRGVLFRDREIPFKNYFPYRISDKVEWRISQEVENDWWALTFCPLCSHNSTLETHTNVYFKTSEEQFPQHYHFSTLFTSQDSTSAWDGKDETTVYHSIWEQNIFGVMTDLKDARRRWIEFTELCIGKSSCYKLWVLAQFSLKDILKVLVRRGCNRG